jgi:hypothetical protein
MNWERALGLTIHSASTPLERELSQALSWALKCLESGRASRDDEDFMPSFECTTGALESLVSLEQTWSRERRAIEERVLSRAQECAGTALKESARGTELIGVGLGYEDDLSYTISWSEAGGARRRRTMSGPELARWLAERAES